MIETLSLAEGIALIAAIAGASVSVYEGYSDRPDGEGFSKKKLTSAFITAITSAMLLINFGVIAEEAQNMNMIAFSVAYFLLGYGGDKGLAKLDSSIGFSKRASKGSGIWGLQNTIKSLDNRIAHLTKQLDDSKEELKIYESWPDSKPAKEIFVALIKREIKQTESQLKAVIEEKAELQREGWI